MAHTVSTPRMPRAERREQVLLAAASAFVRTGFDATSMDDVARAAGVSRLIVYRIFASKFELYTAVLGEVADDLRSSVTPLPKGADVAGVVLGVGRRHPDAFRLLWRHAAHEPEFAEWAAIFRGHVYEFTEALLGDRVEDRLLRHWAARSVVGYLYEAICLWLDEGVPDRDHEVARALRNGTQAMITAWERAPA